MYNLITQDTLWKRFCHQAHCLHIPRAINSLKSSYYFLYSQFRRMYGPYHQLFSRTRRVAVQLRKFLAAHSPLTYESMRWDQLSWTTLKSGNFGGLGFQGLDWIQESWPLAQKELWMLHHQCDGQTLKPPFYDAGLFGTCYLNFRHWPAVWLPLFHCSRVITPTMVLIVFAKVLKTHTNFSLVIESRHTSTRRLVGHVIEYDDASSRYIDMGGSFLDFFETYVMRLQRGDYEISGDGYIQIFPLAGTPQQSRAVTNGIQIIASTLPAVGAHHSVDLHIYWIRMQLFDPEALMKSFPTTMHPTPTCQLKSRSWRIGYKDGSVEQVHGDAVVGDFPLLDMARRTYSYTSMCHGPIDNPPLWMEGEYHFCWGGLTDLMTIAEEDRPARMFDVSIARFHFSTMYFDGILDDVVSHEESVDVEEFDSDDWDYEYEDQGNA